MKNYDDIDVAFKAAAITRERHRKEQETEKIEQEKKYAEERYINSDHPNTMENGSAIFLYIIIMIIGAIFNDRWMIWIMATIILFKFLNRKNIRKKEWNERNK